MGAHCCDFMEEAILERDVEYVNNVRYYGIFTPHSDTGSVIQIRYCPWCNAVLPYDLNSKWDEILEKHNITDPWFSEKDKVPPEFWTDEWWRKRGL